MSAPGAPGARAGQPWSRWLPVLLVPVALLPDLAAALPLRTYFFRDFTVTFLPLRLFAARELREGRVPFWNPYLFEGTFQLPSLYPADLLHALWPSPAFVSWLLTLHLPLAALGAYWLARELGASRAGAFVSGAVFALGGLALSSLNLYVFLQALALAPFAAGLVRRAGLGGGRRVVAAAFAVALALSTLALEFVAQAVVVGLALALAARPRPAVVARAAGAVALGTALAGVPVALTVGLLPETPRGAGLARDVALGNALHPAVLLQAVLPRLFGLPSAVADQWWGGRFFSSGAPYFLSLYVGPLALALAAVGLLRLPRRLRLTTAVLAVAAIWLALGESGGLATLVGQLPLASALRYPVKALLTLHLVVALAAGFGASDLAASRERWPALGRALLVVAAVAGAAALAVIAAPPGLVRWSGVAPSYWPVVAGVVRLDATLLAVWTAAGLLVAWAVHAGRVPAAVGGALVSALLVADLARCGAGLNPQVATDYFDLLQPLRQAVAGPAVRVFSYGVDHSPALRAFLAQAPTRRAEAAFYADRQVLGPYTNLLDGVEAAEANDLTAFSPRGRELSAAEYEPERVSALLPWLRGAAVTRVLSLDTLDHEGLPPLGTVPLGLPGLAVNAYAVSSPWPRAHVACSVLSAPDHAQALALPLAPGFDGSAQVALVGEGEAACSSGTAVPVSVAASREVYDAQLSGGEGYLVVRSSYARGWTATVDGSPARVLRANGKHRAVALPAGRHTIVLEYHPPGLGAGLAVSALALLACAALLAVRA